MRPLTRTTLIVSAALVAIPLTAVTAQERMSRECRREVVKLCGMNRSKIAACLMEKTDQLSETCRTQLRERIAARAGMGEAKGGDRAAEAANKTETIAYGVDPKQAVDFYAAPATNRPGVRKPPLLVYIHGGGWRNGDKRMVATKPSYARSQGWAFASVGYRLLPEAPVEDQARDVAAAIAKLRSEAGRLGFDPDRIVISGHSAGAHLAALIGTDEALTDAATLKAIKAVILLDGAGYDVAEQMKLSPVISKKLYEPAFGTDPARQKALSPAAHTSAPNVARWLIIHDDSRKDAEIQSRQLGALLTRAGASAEVLAVPGTHMTINRDFGTAGYAAQPKIDALLKSVAS